SVTSVAFGPGGQLAAGYAGYAGVGDVGGVVLFDARGRRLRPEPLVVREGGVTSVAFGPGGQVAAGYSSGFNGRVVLFDTRGERFPHEPLSVRNGRVTSVAFSPDGHDLAFTESDMVRLMDLSTSPPAALWARVD